MAMHQLGTSDDDEQHKAEDIVDQPALDINGAMEEVDPDQLREPALDELAPLTTEDYRPVPPSQRVNRRSAVTHTEIGPIIIDKDNYTKIMFV